MTKKLTPLKRIKLYCKEQCCTNDLKMWRYCEFFNCSLFLYRFGKRIPNGVEFIKYKEKMVLDSKKGIEELERKRKINIEKYNQQLKNYDIKHQSYGKKFRRGLKNNILKRDNYTCQICEKRMSQNTSNFAIHHIDYNKKNNSKSNLITLCPYCHAKTNGKRKYWTFQLNLLINLFNVKYIKK